MLYTFAFLRPEVTSLVASSKAMSGPFHGGFFLYKPRCCTNTIQYQLRDPRLQPKVLKHGVPKPEPPSQNPQARVLKPEPKAKSPQARVCKD
jgi:hypothetical protein